MKMNIDKIIEKARMSVEAHKVAPGKYTRYCIDPETGEKCNEINEYGCADAANILYTINDMPKSVEEKMAFVDTLRSFQNKETGLFHEKTHHPYHGTAHCMGAIELFDEKVLYPLKGMEEYLDIDKIPSWLSGLAWETCRGSGHIAAGVFSALYLSGSLSLEWQDVFFGWLDENCDEEYGINIKGMYKQLKVPVWHHMGDWFHILFCYYSARRSFPHPEKLIDNCLEMYHNDKMDQTFGKGQRFLDIDWAFCVNRAANQSGYRVDDCKEALRKFAADYIDYLEKSPMEECQWNDMHLMFGAMCALSELQCALPGEIVSTRVMRQILDRRPFI